MRYFALIPAAGGGARMAAKCPKQYLPVAGKPMLRHTVEALCRVAVIDKVFVVLAPDDVFWDGYDWRDLTERISVLRCGGDTRAESVANGLRAMCNMVQRDDWVLVHDAARCCLTRRHVENLIETVAADPVGGLLAVPLADTLKRAQTGGRVEATVPREGLWQAQTPQMFRYGVLCDALARAPAVTDEASAIEALGLHPRLVAADAMNLKVTYPLDLQLAEWILRNREN